MSHPERKKIVLNVSTDALVAMLGGDSELEVQLRNSIAQEFTRKYLKGIVNEQVVKEALNGASTAATAALEEFFVRDTWSTCWKPKPELDTAIKLVVRKKIDIIISETVQQYVDTLDINELIKLQVEHTVQSRIKAGVTAEISRIMNNALKQAESITS